VIDRVLLSKARSIERCIERVREEYVGHEAEFATNWSRQDAVVMNLIRACEQAIDMGNRMTLLRRLPIADDAQGVFGELGRQRLISAALSKAMQAMQAMVGFRNIAVHEYQELDIEKVRHIVEHRLADLQAFSTAMLRADPGG
jgi:uncharacterized protein YutE (UPF0331/DUF86 family)